MTTDAVLVAQKIKLAMARGDCCTGALYNKTAREWGTIFNAVSEKLNMPVVHVGPLRKDSKPALDVHMGRIVAAFETAANASAIVLVDMSGDHLIRNPHMKQAIGKFMDNLGKRFPKAVYTQIVPEENRPQMAVFRCMNPGSPKTGNGPAPV